MAIGDGNAGGNSSVYWEVNKNHKSATPGLAVANPVAALGASARAVARPAAAAGAAGVVNHPGRGEVLIREQGVAGHTDSDFAAIGRSNPPASDDHPGKFRVRLRFRKADLGTLDPAQRDWIVKQAREIPELDPESLFLVVDVPAIHRAQPADGADWEDQPWEIHWEW